MFNPITSINLPNGASILDRAFINRTWIWLGEWENDYITWEARGADPGATYHGHYFMKNEGLKEALVKAKEDFQIRAIKQFP